MHHGAQSFRQQLPLRKQLEYNRSAFRYFYKYHGAGAALLLACTMPFNLLISVCYQAVKKYAH